LPLAEPDEPTIRDRLGTGKKSAAAFRIRIHFVIEFVALRLHLAHTPARQSKRTRRRRSVVLRRLRQERRKEIGRFDWFERIAAAWIGIELRRRQRRIEDLFLAEEITPALFQSRFHPVAVYLDVRVAALPNDLDGRVLAVAEIDLDDVSFARSLRHHARVLAIAKVDLHFAVSLSRLRVRTAIDLDPRAIVSSRAIIAFAPRIAEADCQRGQREEQPSASRSAQWPTRGHREAKDAGNASALASLRAARKKGDFRSRGHAILV